MELEAPGEESESMNKHSSDTNELNSDDENEMLKSGSEDRNNDDDVGVPVDANTDEDDEDDDDDEAEERNDEAEVKILQAALAENPYVYDTHLALIKKLQKLCDLDRLRAAREHMSSRYPLSPEIWLSWLHDEMKLANTPDQRYAVTMLFERAVKDYNCKH